VSSDADTQIALERYLAVSQDVARALHRAPWYCKGVGLGSILHSTWHHWLVSLNGTRDSDPYVFRFVCASGEGAVNLPLHLRDADFDLAAEMVS
jgi:hypothetical protein